MTAENHSTRIIISLYRFLFRNDSEHLRHIFAYPRRASNYLLRFFRGKTKISEANIEHPSFSTNIFDQCEEREAKLQENWFWLLTVIAIFCLGVSASYYIIHNF